MMCTSEYLFGVYFPILLLFGVAVGSQATNVSLSSPAVGGRKMLQCVCDPLCGNKTTCETNGKCYASKSLFDTKIIRHCFHSEEQSYMQCKSKLQSKTWLQCCDDRDFCNADLEFTQPAAVQQANADVEDPNKILIITVAASLSALLVIVLVLLLICRRRHNNSLAARDGRLLEEDSFRGFGDGSKEDQWSTGSGSGAPVLVKRTVGKEVTLEERIGKGRYGEVWRGTWRGQDVAVKIFTSREESSWNQESDMYNTCMLRHENILGYHASDTVGRFSTTQMWLMFDYHRNGSLYDYLQCSDLDLEEMLVLAHSAAAGLSHLHNEIKQGNGRHEKPAIAHRDVKTKNMLVKANGECCIGDLGHAVRSDVLEAGNSPEKLLVGTKRYMAPEVLTGSLNPEFFESFKCVDVYAFGLVLWEIARRARPFAEEYRVPFWEVVPADPSFEEMKLVAAVQQIRPPIPNKWDQEPLMKEMANLMKECWAANPKVRLTILRVKKNLQRMLQQVTQEHAQRVEKLTPKITDSSISGSTSGNSMSGNSNSSSIAYR